MALESRVAEQLASGPLLEVMAGNGKTPRTLKQITKRLYLRATAADMLATKLERGLVDPVLGVIFSNAAVDGVRSTSDELVCLADKWSNTDYFEAAGLDSVRDRNHRLLGIAEKRAGWSKRRFEHGEEHLLGSTSRDVRTTCLRLAANCRSVSAAIDRVL